MIRWFQIVLVCYTCITGCTAVKSVTDWVGGDEDNTQPPTPLTEINTRADILEIWKKGVGKGSDDKFLKLSPALIGDRIYVANNDGDIKAIDALSGKVIWNKDINKKISGGPGANHNLVIAGTSEGEVITVNSETGNILWEAKVSSEVLAAPQTDDNIVVVRTIDGKIFGLSAENGKKLWVYDRTVPVLTLRGTSAPVIADGLVIAGFDGGRMSAIALDTGKLVWETRVAIGSGRSELERMVDIDAEPLVVDGIIYVATYQGRIAAVDLDSGSILWTRDISSYAGLGVDTRNVYVTDDNSHVWALDRISGNSVWKQEARTVTAPAPVNELVVVGDVEGYLHWLDKASGQFVARTKISGKKFIAPPISAGDKVFAYSSDGTLGAYTNHPLEEITQQTEQDVSEQTEEVNEDIDPAVDEQPEQVNADIDPAIDEQTEIPSNESEQVAEEVTEKPGEEEKGGIWSRVLDIFSGSGDEEE